MLLLGTFQPLCTLAILLYTPMEMEVKSNFISLVHIKLLYTSTKVTLYALVHIKLLYTSTKDTLYALVHIKLLYTSTIICSIYFEA